MDWTRKKFIIGSNNSIETYKNENFGNGITWKWQDLPVRKIAAFT